VSDGGLGPELPDDEDAPSDRRLIREGGEKGRGRSLSERISARLARLSYGGILHRRRLRGRTPLKILVTPSDPIMGNAEKGRELASGRLALEGHSEPIRTLRFTGLSAPRRWLAAVHGFTWLRDLAAVTDRRRGAVLTEMVVEAWLARYRDYDDLAWRSDILGRRLLFWTLYAPYVLSRSEPIYRSLVLNHLARGARHLDRAYDKAGDGMPRIEAIAGLLAAGLMLPEGEQRAERAEAALKKALDSFLYPDGGVVTRRPLDMLALAELLVTLRSLYLARRMPISETVSDALATLASGLKGVMLGDGALAAIHGGAAGTAARASHVVKLIGGAARPLRNGVASGFQRLSAGNTVIVVDAGPPPVARLTSGGHAGTLAFEMSDGDTRMVVNCGGAPEREPMPDNLAQALRTTAAHSTLTLADTNSTQIRTDGGLGRGIGEVVVTRHESEEGSWLDAAHDGYVRKFGLTHRRRIFLSADGRDLRGEDALLSAGSRLGRRKGVAFDVRFHLGPGIEATPTADGKGALVKLPAGQVWQVKARGGELSVDESIWVDEHGRARPISQLVISGRTDAGGGAVNWSFKRAGR
jgi:uncharacterized heparinase superfamily protein